MGVDVGTGVDELAYELEISVDHGKVKCRLAMVLRPGIGRLYQADKPLGWWAPQCAGGPGRLLAEGAVGVGGLGGSHSALGGGRHVGRGEVVDRAVQRVEVDVVRWWRGVGWPPVVREEASEFG